MALMKILQSAVVLAVATTFLGAQQPTSSPVELEKPKGESPATKDIQSPDGALQISVPTTWSAMSEPIPQSLLYVGNQAEQVFVSVYSEMREDLAEDMSVDRYIELRRDWMTSHLENPETSDPEFFELNGKRAVRIEMRGEQSGYRYVYVATIFETPNRLNLVYASTRPSKFKANKELLDTVWRSLSEVQR